MCGVRVGHEPDLPINHLPFNKSAVFSYSTSHLWCSSSCYFSSSSTPGPHPPADRRSVSIRRHPGCPGKTEEDCHSWCWWRQVKSLLKTPERASWNIVKVSPAFPRRNQFHVLVQYTKKHFQSIVYWVLGSTSIISYLFLLVFCPPYDCLITIWLLPIEPIVPIYNIANTQHQIPNWNLLCQESC